MWMGPRAFHYYMHATINHLRREAATGAEAAMLLTDVEFRTEHDSQDLTPVARELTEFCQYVIDQWPRFQEDAEPYGDVLPRYINLRDALSRLDE